ncbi:Dehydroquinate synthase-like protein [Cylindrobasidium torrendii FP15055 ss-10]|uniref:Dehydroquinate synthase-like protein n=1 Tax=Cylindrobasidium torrendii FP15055 ss-10 TaxID=1314674 RepID=A0A0D7BU30_9AGAR|nr:Dehydroquinate synthase-like protein [Cylindrobasidium torrendii FP15055 ss-10]
MSETLAGSYGWTDTISGVYYGPGSVTTALPKLMKSLGGTKALIVTGKSLYTKTNVVSKVQAILEGIGAYGGVFHEIGQHTPVNGIHRGMELFKQQKCDIIVAVGGGSPIDAAKTILYNLREDTGGPMLRQIAIPTTLSAAEFAIGAGYTNEAGQKVGVSSPDLAASGIILDAELTLSTPERLWLSTGIRALDHAVENLYRPGVPHPMKRLCYASIVDLFTYLPESKDDSKDVLVRQKLQLAAWMGYWPMKQEKYTPLGLSHALGHRLGATYSIPHGITSCLTLPAVVAMQADIQTPEFKEDLAQAVYQLRRDSTGSVEGDIRLFSKLIHGLIKDLGLASTLTEYHVPEEDFPAIIKPVVPLDDPRFKQVVELLKGLM